MSCDAPVLVARPRFSFLTPFSLLLFVCVLVRLGVCSVYVGFQVPCTLYYRLLALQFSPPEFAPYAIALVVGTSQARAAQARANRCEELMYMCMSHWRPCARICPLRVCVAGGCISSILGPELAKQTVNAFTKQYAGTRTHTDRLTSHRHAHGTCWKWDHIRALTRTHTISIRCHGASHPC